MGLAQTPPSESGLNQKRGQMSRKTNMSSRRAERLHFELREVPFVKQAEELAERATRGFAQQVANLLDPLPIATKRQVARIDRRVTQLARKLRTLEKGRNTKTLGRRPDSQSPSKHRSRKKK